MKNNICGYHFFIGNRKNIINSIFHQIDSKNYNTTITCLDSNFLGNYYANPRCIEFYNNYDYLINSSKIVRIMSIIKRKKVKYISHVKMMNDILKEVQNRNYTVYIYAKKTNIYYIKKYFSENYSGINIVGISDDSESDEKVVSHIRKTKSDVVLIGNTFNIQSEFILDNIGKFNSKIIISCAQFFAKISDVKIKNNNLKFLKKYLKVNIDEKKKKKCKKKGYVVGWFYPPQTTAQAISTYKILKNSKI
ncbi:MAG: WecB/TagA/CpsF family glycosyltransferase, partial [Bacilli bacterium]|nr:WecB/TagA/CpsF family glycosyltransferase [Bacilli bacterium]